jgi:beta-galactosidase/beta-glucuronidase
MDEKWFKHFPKPTHSMYVPSCWNNELNLYDYEGAAWYRTIFTLADTEHIRLIFHGILNHADVYLNGEHLGYHYGGIIRPVELQRIPDVFIENFKMDYKQDPGKLSNSEPAILNDS